MSDHIKGPWVMVPRVSGSENHRGYRIADASNWYFAEVMPIDSDGIEGRARANLIASGPDMLKALRKAALALAHAGEQSPGLYTDAYETVSAAIAKATGEEK